MADKGNKPMTQGERLADEVESLQKKKEELLANIKEEADAGKKAKAESEVLRARTEAALRAMARNTASPDESPSTATPLTAREKKVSELMSRGKAVEKPKHEDREGKSAVSQDPPSNQSESASSKQRNKKKGARKNKKKGARK